MKIDFNAIHVFNWDNLYYIELENEVGIEAFKKLCDNQEGEMEKLHPDEQSSYYMQIFERDEVIIKEIYGNSGTLCVCQYFHSLKVD